MCKGGSVEERVKEAATYFFSVTNERYYSTAPKDIVEILKEIETFNKETIEQNPIHAANLVKSAILTILIESGRQQILKDSRLNRKRGDERT